MSNEKKPEWFEIVERDQPTRKERSSRRIFSRPILALALSGLVIGVGALYASADEENPVVAKAPVATSAKVAVESTQPAAVQQPSSGIQNPMNTEPRGRGDGDFEEHHGHEGRHGEHDRFEFDGD